MTDMGEGRTERWSKSGTVLLLARLGMALAGLLTPIAVAVGLWVGNTLWDLNTKVTSLIAQQPAIASLYTRAAATSDLRILQQKNMDQDGRIADNRADIQENRTRIRSLENSKGRNGG